ncbi:MAG: M48 family metallopeptidase [Candidatus Sabulitectum sp.]|nr:M48 family metallopeptidase [Candidatus Sabulitectum sp.]
MTAGVDQRGYSLRYSSRARRISIRVSPGSVSVIAPTGADQKVIDAFVESRKQWIEEKLALFSSFEGPSSLVQLEDGAVLWFFGRELHLQVVENKTYPIVQNDRLLLEETWLFGNRLFNWLEEQLLITVGAFADHYKEKAGKSPQRIRIGNARTRWGSCSAGGVIMMNRKLVHAPLNVIEYVFVHELVHLKHRNHSHLFWGTVERYLGDVRHLKKWLRLQGAHLL